MAWSSGTDHLDGSANSGVESHVIIPCCASDWPDNCQANLAQDVAKTGGRSQNHMQEQEYYHRYIELILESVSSGVHSRSPSQIDTCSEIKHTEKAEALRPPPLICTLYSGRNKLSQVSVGLALSHRIKAWPRLGCSFSCYMYNGFGTSVSSTSIKHQDDPFVNLAYPKSREPDESRRAERVSFLSASLGLQHTSVWVGGWMGVKCASVRIILH